MTPEDTQQPGAPFEQDTYAALRLEMHDHGSRDHDTHDLTVRSTSAAVLSTHDWKRQQHQPEHFHSGNVPAFLAALGEHAGEQEVQEASRVLKDRVLVDVTALLITIQRTRL